MEYNQVFNKPEIDQDWWDLSCLFDSDTPLLADRNTVAQPLPPVLDHVYRSNSTMPDSDPPPPAPTNQEEYFLANQDRRHFYDFPSEPRFDTPPTDHRINTVHNSDQSAIPTTTQEGYYSKTDQERSDFRLERVIDGYDELELDCPFIELLTRMAAPIRKISASPESQEAEATVKPGKKRNRWTDEEHRLFLEGLEVYGDSNWINISREFVKTRTNIQIASHAQKHYLRQGKKKKSIHGVTTE